MKWLKNLWTKWFYKSNILEAYNYTKKYYIKPMLKEIVLPKKHARNIVGIPTRIQGR